MIDKRMLPRFRLSNSVSEWYCAFALIQKARAYRLAATIEPKMVKFATDLSSSESSEVSTVMNFSS